MWVLYRRFAAPGLLNGEVLTTVGAPIIFMVGFYIPFAIPDSYTQPTLPTSPSL